MEDGRSNLVLHGVYRVRFSAWPGGKSYPVAHIVPMTADPFPSDEGPLMASKLRDRVNEALSGFPLEVKKEINHVLDRANDEPSILADAVAQQFVQDPEIRLQILSEPSLDARYELLMRYLKLVRDQT
jgi:Lon protease-like protein